MSEKISAMPTAASLTGSELIPVVQGGDNVKTTAQAIADLGGGGAGYSTYTAILTPDFSDGPVFPAATILGTNTIGDIVWTRFATGLFVGTLAGAFPTGKTFLPSGTINTFLGYTYWFERLDDDRIEFYTGKEADVSDDGFSDPISIEIRVYP